MYKHEQGWNQTAAEPLHILYLDLEQQSREAGDEVCEAGVRHILLTILRRVAQLYHLLGLFFTTPPQLCRVISWNHALIWGELDGHNGDSNIKQGS